jgi:catechol 2,3-dioxygenase-like lactoylglutathione lyase family enzyme
MRLSNVILRVSDMGAALEFWEQKVGLDVVLANPEFAFLALGEVQLALNRLAEFESQASDTEIVIEVDDLYTAYEEMRERGVRFEVEPRPVTTDGDRTLLATHFRDPDGHLASITGWVDGVYEL